MVASKPDSMSPLFKSRLVLLTILVLWASLLIGTWRGWYQILVTILAWVLNNEKLNLYRYGLWIAQDQDVNALIFGNPDVTVSSKLGYMKQQGSRTAQYAANVVDKMFYIAVGQVNHCVASIEHDELHYTTETRFNLTKKPT